MHTYQTMTIAGVPGNTYHAMTTEDAARLAHADGYEVVDVQEPNLLIISA